MNRQDWAAERAIVHAILSGTEDAVFTRYRVSPQDQIVYRRETRDAVAGLVRRQTAFRSSAKLPIRNPIRWTSRLAGTLALTAMFVAGWLFPNVSLTERDTLPVLTGFVGLAAVAVAALGWGVSVWVTHRTARAKHTLDVISARFGQPAFNKAFSDFNKGFSGKTINPDLINRYDKSDKEDERAALQGLRYLVNYFEFIAVAIMAGEIDPFLIDETLRGNIIYVYDECEIYIDEVRTKNTKVLENFVRLRLSY